MKQEERELLLRDLCGRLPYGVKVETFTNCWTSEKGVCELKEIFKGDDGLFRAGDIGCIIENYKPYLFPLTSITEEQYYEMNICSSEDCVEHFDILRSIQEHTEFSKWPLYEYRVIDFFHKNHFDYRGLIPMGLAIDATGLNIY